MKYLRIIWVRIFVSLFCGAFIAELSHVLTGDPNRPRVEGLTLLYAVIFFVALSIMIRKRGK
jgi:hypothetical protein